MKAILGKKIGMTSMFDEAGKNHACTVVEAGPCYVTQVKTEDTDGYNAVQVGFGERKEKRTNKAMAGHYKKSGVTPKQKVVEFRDFELEASTGDEITVEIFDEGDIIAVTGTSKGKGFQGVVKRHGFSGVGMRTHGQHNRNRAPGSIGMSSTPSRVLKGMRMGGRTGGAQTTTKNLEILKIMPEKNLMIIKGSVPGAKGSYLVIAN